MKIFKLVNVESLKKNALAVALGSEHAEHKNSNNICPSVITLTFVVFLMYHIDKLIHFTSI